MTEANWDTLIQGGIGILTLLATTGMAVLMLIAKGKFERTEAKVDATEGMVKKTAEVLDVVHTVTNANLSEVKTELRETRAENSKLLEQIGAISAEIRGLHKGLHGPAPVAAPAPAPVAVVEQPTGQTSVEAAADKIANAITAKNVEVKAEVVNVVKDKAKPS